MSNDTFSKALGNLTHDFASAGAIRHLADLGLNVYEIKDKLDFPTPIEKIASTVWQHFIDTGKVRLEEPDNTPGDFDTIESVDYETVYDSYGKPCFKRIVTSKEIPKRNYLMVDFGLLKYQNPSLYNSFLNALEKKKKTLLNLFHGRLK